MSTESTASIDLAQLDKLEALAGAALDEIFAAIDEAQRMNRFNESSFQIGVRVARLKCLADDYRAALTQQAGAAAPSREDAQLRTQAAIKASASRDAMRDAWQVLMDAGVIPGLAPMSLADGIRAALARAPLPAQEVQPSIEMQRAAWNSAVATVRAGFAESEAASFVKVLMTQTLDSLNVYAQTTFDAAMRANDSDTTKKETKE